MKSESTRIRLVSVRYFFIILCKSPSKYSTTMEQLVYFFSHEDIKDAMLSLVHMMRENTEKLERHEARERQLGEQLKKTIAVLTKRISTVDAVKLQLTKLDEKVMGIEQLMAQVFY